MDSQDDQATAILRDATGARDLLLANREHGERVFEQLWQRHGEHGLLYYWRGEAHRASGRRKLAHADFVRAVELLPDGPWRQRAVQAVRRTRSHHDPAVRPTTG